VTFYVFYVALDKGIDMFRRDGPYITSLEAGFEDE